jgi:hypothetical protein
VKLNVLPGSTPMLASCARISASVCARGRELQREVEILEEILLREFLVDLRERDSRSGWRRGCFRLADSG